MTTFNHLIRTKFDRPRLVARRGGTEWTALLAQANDFLDLEVRLTALTQARSTLDTLQRRAA